MSSAAAPQCGVSPVRRAVRIGASAMPRSAASARDLGQRDFQVLVDVVAQRLERRNVDASASRRQGAQRGRGATRRSMADQKRRQRLAGAGGRGDQDVVARADFRPAQQLRFGRCARNASANHSATRGSNPVSRRGETDTAALILTKQYCVIANISAAHPRPGVPRLLAFHGMTQQHFGVIFYASALAIACIAPHSAFGMPVVLSPSTPSPAPVGTVITWTAYALDEHPGRTWYRFRINRVGAEPRIVRDFGPSNSFDWTATDYDGQFQIEVSVHNRDTGDSGENTQVFEMTSLVTGDQAVITPTSNSFVFLYSAPSCPDGARMHVEFRRGDGPVQRTPARDCHPGFSVNFYLAGLRAETQYTARHVIERDSVTEQRGARISFTTGELPELPQQTVVNGPPPVVTEPVLLQATLFTNPVATDIEGNIVWYYPGTLSFLTRPAPGGRFLRHYPGAGRRPRRAASSRVRSHRYAPARNQCRPRERAARRQGHAAGRGISPRSP